MLYTNLKHIENAEQFRTLSGKHACCSDLRTHGKDVDPGLRIAEELEQSYRHIKFFDMELDNPESQVILDLLR
jgi:thioredoxin 1